MSRAKAHSVFSSQSGVSSNLSYSTPGYCRNGRWNAYSAERKAPAQANRQQAFRMIVLNNIIAPIPCYTGAEFISMSYKLICGLVLFSGWMLAVERGQEMRLWPHDAPGSEGETAQEVSQPSDNPKLPKRFTVVHYPSIYVFLPPREKANGIAVVIAPGGGHSQLVIDKEGWDIADWLNQNGIAGVVVKYRLARAPTGTTR